MNNLMDKVTKKTSVILLATAMSLGANVAVADQFAHVPKHESANKYKKLNCAQLEDMFFKLKKQSLRVVNDKRHHKMTGGDRLNDNSGQKTKIRTKMKAVRKAATKKECKFSQ